jgi:hypothetical protein
MGHGVPVRFPRRCNLAVSSYGLVGGSSGSVGRCQAPPIDACAPALAYLAHARLCLCDSADRRGYAAHGYSGILSSDRMVRASIHVRMRRRAILSRHIASLLPTVRRRSVRCRIRCIAWHAVYRRLCHDRHFRHMGNRHRSAIRAMCPDCGPLPLEPPRAMARRSRLGRAFRPSRFKRS